MAGRFPFTGWGRRLLLLVAALVLGALPGVVRAESLIFRNDTTMPLVLQGACVIKGQLRADQPVSVAPGNVARINLPGSKLLTIYHARLPNRPLFQATIPGASDDQYFAIEPDPPRVKLEPKKPFPVPGAGSMPGPGPSH